MYNKTLHEILSTRVWMLPEATFCNYREAIRSNMIHHVAVENLNLGNKLEDYRMLLGKSGITYQVGMDYSAEDGGIPEGEEIVKSVLVLNICGPVTRNGDLCTYGSIDHRDLLMAAAEDEECAGVVFVINTPGGSAFAMHDYRQGIDAMKDKGKRCIAFIDGICCSAGVALACQCDYITVMNPHDEIGCIGAMIACELPIDGSIVDGMRYVSITASQTPDKNIEAREAASGDYEKLQSIADDCANEFLSLIDEMRPQITKEQRSGKVYKAMDVMGTLVDGVASFNACIDYVLGGTMELSIPSHSAFASQPEEKCNPDKEKNKCNPDPNKNPKNMNYQNIMATLGLTEIATQEDGIFLNAELVDQLDAALAPVQEPAVAEASEETPAAEQEVPASEPAAPEASAEAPTAEPAAEVAEPADVPGDQSPVDTEPSAPEAAAEAPTAEPAAEVAESAATAEGAEAPADAEAAEPAAPAAPSEGAEAPTEAAAPVAEPAAEGAEPSAVPGDQSPVNSPAETHFAEQLAAMQLQHEQEMATLRSEIESLRQENTAMANRTIPAPTPKNHVSTPIKERKNFHDMTLAEKAEQFNALGKK